MVSPPGGIPSDHVWNEWTYYYNAGGGQSRMEPTHGSDRHRELGIAWLLPLTLSRWTLRPPLVALVQHRDDCVWAALRYPDASSSVSSVQLASPSLYPLPAWSIHALSGISNLSLSIRLWTSTAPADQVAALWCGCGTLYHFFWALEYHAVADSGDDFRALCHSSTANVVALHSTLALYRNPALPFVGYRPPHQSHARLRHAHKYPCPDLFWWRDSPPKSGALSDGTGGAITSRHSRLNAGNRSPVPASTPTHPEDHRPSLLSPQVRCGQDSRRFQCDITH